LRSIWEYEGSPETRAGLRLMAYLYPRPGELRKAKWPEFDLDNKTWVLPKERMKMRKEHKKPLPDAAIAVLKDLHNLTGYRELVFPSYQSPLRPMNENTFNSALRRMGYSKTEATAHGFRASASSLLNESRKWSPDAIEAELAHVGADDVCRVLTHVKKQRHPIKNKVIVLLSFKAGLRAYEIAGLDWTMVLQTNGEVSDSIIISKDIAKNKSGRNIPMNKSLAIALVKLHRFMNKPSYGAVIQSERIRPMTARSIVNWFASTYAIKALSYACSSALAAR